MARNFRKKINSRGNRKRDVNQIGVPQSRSHLAGEGFIDGATSLRFANDVGAVPAGNAHLLRVFAQRQRKRTADQPGAENRHARDEMTGRHGSGNAAADGGSDDA